MTSEPRRPLWLYPNLLSLDAPLVAVVWLFIFLKTWRVISWPEWPMIIALFLTVWVIYVADRLLDVSLRDKDSPPAEARHLFHNKYRRYFKRGALAASGLALVCALSAIKPAFFEYIPISLVFVAIYFAISLFSSRGGQEIPYAKNVVAGFAFAFGTAMTANVYVPALGGVWNMLISREFICFGVLCLLNISAIDLWEHANRYPDPEVKATDELALSLPLTLLGAASLIFAERGDQETRPFFYAILTGAALLQILNRTRARFSMDLVRVLADVALLLPALIFFGFPGN